MASSPLSRRMAVELPALELAWSDFDRWQAFFAEADCFPAGWEDLRGVPPPRTAEAEAYLLRKTALFTDWLDRLQQRAPTLEHDTRQGLRARIERQHAGQDCPVCAPFDGREAGPELATVPPFHPGCRCVLQAVSTGPARRRPRAR
jgi:hypothetical protein